MELYDGEINWQEEAPILWATGRKIPFQVPENYFDQMEAALSSRIEVEKHRFEEKEEFRLPELYFEQLPGEILNQLSIANIRHLTDGEAMRVPDAYFDTLTAKINQSVSENQTEKTSVRKLIPRWLSIAAAACTTVVLGSVLYLNSDYYNLNQELSKIPDQEIINYLQVHSTMSDTPFIIEQLNPEQMGSVSSEISSEELEIYLDNTTL